jgi:hypothetical protein
MSFAAKAYGIQNPLAFRNYRLGYRGTENGKQAV